jgi:hypothetical protein
VRQSRQSLDGNDPAVLSGAQHEVDRRAAEHGPLPGTLVERIHRGEGAVGDVAERPDRDPGGIPVRQRLRAQHATGTFRIVGTDYTTSTLGPYLVPKLFLAAPGMEVRIESRDQDSYANLERGRVDPAMSPVVPAAPLRWEQLFTDDVACLVDRDHPARDRIPPADYVAARHVVISVIANDQPLIERRLHAHGHVRTAACA